MRRKWEKEVTGEKDVVALVATALYRKIRAAVMLREKLRRL